MKRGFLSFLCCLPLCLFLAAPPVSRGCGSTSSTITPIPSLGGSAFQINALSSKGDVTGFSYTAGNLEAHAFLFRGNVQNDLGTLGGTYSQGFAVNASGQIAGEASLMGDAVTHAFFYDGTNMIDLQTLGGSFSSGAVINDAGHVAGTSFLSGDSDQTAFLYSNKTMVDLGSLGGGGSSAIAMNQADDVAGQSRTTNGETHAFLYCKRVMRDLGTLGGDYSYPFALNDSALVVGESSTTNGDTHGFLWSSGNMVDLGTLGGTYSRAIAINASGNVLGLSTTTNDLETHGFLFTGGVMTDLGTLGGDYSDPMAMNNLGQIVGDSGLPNGFWHAFIWQNGSMVDLNSFLPANSGWELDSAISINDAGRILGYGAFNGTESAYVLDLAAGANHAPVAVPGLDQTVECPSLVSLNGSSSMDPDGDPITYEWSESGSVFSTQAVVAASFPVGLHTVTLKVTDSCGASSQADVKVRVVDSLAPTILHYPATLTLSCGADCLASVPNVLPDVAASDSCTPPAQLVMTQTPAAGTKLGAGSYTMNVTVSDASSNSATAMVTLKVVDTTAPSFVSVPGPISLSADANCQAVVPNVLSDVKASDNCTPADKLVITQTPAAGTAVGTGSHTITVTVCDSGSNSATATVSLNVVDTSAPSITNVPGPITLSANANCQAVVPNVLANLLVSDNCTPVSQLSLTQSPAAGTIVGLGSLTITVVATDAAGNSATVKIPLNVVDTTAPVIQSLSVTPSVLSPPNHQMVPVTVSVVAKDACDPAPISKIVSISCNEQDAPGDAQTTGNLTANLAATRNPSGPGRIYTLVVQCKDASGNVSTASVTVTVPKGNGK